MHAPFSEISPPLFHERVDDAEKGGGKERPEKQKERERAENLSRRIGYYGTLRFRPNDQERSNVESRAIALLVAIVVDSPDLATMEPTHIPGHFEGYQKKIRGKTYAEVRDMQAPFLRMTRHLGKEGENLVTGAQEPVTQVNLRVNDASLRGECLNGADALNLAESDVRLEEVRVRPTDPGDTAEKKAALLFWFQVREHILTRIDTPPPLVEKAQFKMKNVAEELQWVRQRLLELQK